MATPEIEFDTLAGLEERVQKAVALVQRLRHERDAALKEVSGLKADVAGLTEELDGLRAERKQVRARIEKLLGHIDQLGA